MVVLKALITGINGFVGEYLAHYLLTKDIVVWGTDLSNERQRLNNNIIYRKMNITDNSEVEAVLCECNPDYVYHLAAQSSAAISWKEPQTTIDVNINGTICLIESIRKLNKNSRILLIGSSEEYGFVNIGDMPIGELQRLNPGNPYAVSKIAQTLIGQVYARAYGLNIVIVRAFNHIGPKQSPNFVVSDFAKRIAEIEKGKREPTLLVGNLEAERDFTDVKDVIEAYCGIIEKGKAGEIYNVGTGKPHKIRYLLDCLLSYTGEHITIQEDPNRMRPSDVPVIYCDNSKVKDLIDWHPKFKIEDTLLEVLNYWRQEIN